MREYIPAALLGGLAVLLVAAAAAGVSERVDAEQRPSADGSRAQVEAPGWLGALHHLSDVQLPQELSLCGQPIPLERPEVREALTYELLLTLGRPMMPALWLRRAPEHLPRIEDQLERAELPDDLKYLVVVESDLRPWVESPAGALGLWQIMRDTGRRYGLRIDRYIDERLDPVRSGEAGMAYLRELHDEFGDWFLALAAYNAGENAVRRSLERDDSRDYFKVFLPRETRRYVLRIAAAKLVMRSPSEYGVPRLQRVPQPEPARVVVHVREPRVPLEEVARDQGVGYGMLRRMNPWLVSQWLPEGEHRLRLPAARESASEARATRAR